MARPKLPLVVRFLGGLREGPGSCWSWVGDFHPDYGPRLQVAGTDLDGRSHHASVCRVAWRLYRDPTFGIRAGKRFQAVRRTCSNRRCVNPEHLELRSQAWRWC